VTAIDERVCGVGEKIVEKKRCGREEESIYGEPPGPQQLSINQNRFNYKKRRKVWAKWDVREEEEEQMGRGKGGLPLLYIWESHSVAHGPTCATKFLLSVAHGVTCATETRHSVAHVGPCAT